MASYSIQWLAFFWSIFSIPARSTFVSMPPLFPTSFTLVFNWTKTKDHLISTHSNIKCVRINVFLCNMVKTWSSEVPVSRQERAKSKRSKFWELESVLLSTEFTASCGRTYEEIRPPITYYMEIMIKKGQHWLGLFSSWRGVLFRLQRVPQPPPSNSNINSLHIIVKYNFMTWVNDSFRPFKPFKWRLRTLRDNFFLLSITLFC